MRVHRSATVHSREVAVRPRWIRCRIIRHTAKAPGHPNSAPREAGRLARRGGRDVDGPDGPCPQHWLEIPLRSGRHRRRRWSRSWIPCETATALPVSVSRRRSGVSKRFRSSGGRRLHDHSVGRLRRRATDGRARRRTGVSIGCGGVCRASRTRRQASDTIPLLEAPSSTSTSAFGSAPHRGRAVFGAQGCGCLVDGCFRTNPFPDFRPLGPTRAAAGASCRPSASRRNPT
jgi:hypothetical protein